MGRETATTIKRKMVLAVAFAIGACGVMLMAQVAGATHPRPKGASPFQVPLVPAYENCTSPNRTHGPPLASPSCNPPVQSSSFLTVGTPDANGAAANSVGWIRLDVHIGPPGPPDDSEVRIKATISDVRCKAGTSACGNANTVGGRDYIGDLQADAMIRISDHFNAVDPGGGTDPATVVDIPFPINLYCANTADPSIGGVCNVNTYCPLPGGCGPKDGDRTVVGITQFKVIDGGPDGSVATDDGNTIFAAQGLFVP
jgi:hypothetical protein